MLSKTTNTRDVLVGKKILIIEDEPSISRMYEKWLKKFMINTRIANNGALGLKMLESDPFDLVLLDLGMPGMDGYRTLSHLRKNPKIKNMPVVILSNTTMQEGRDGFDEIVKLGIEGVWRKYETSLDKLVDQIAKIISDKQN